jgi:hypothetical protein
VRDKPLDLLRCPRARFTFEQIHALRRPSSVRVKR